MVPRHPPNALLILIHHRPHAGSIRAITDASRTTTCPIGQQQHRDTHSFHGEVSPAEHSISPTLLHHEKQQQKTPMPPKAHQGGFLEVPPQDQRSRAELVTLTWRRSDSNRRPPACKAGALPTELRPQRRTPGPTGPTRRHPRKGAARMGQGGLEPPTPRLSSVCSNQLSYWPKNQSLGCVRHSGTPRLRKPPCPNPGTAQGRMRGQRPS